MLLALNIGMAVIAVALFLFVNPAAGIIAALVAAIVALRADRARRGI